MTDASDINPGRHGDLPFSAPILQHTDYNLNDDGIISAHCPTNEGKQPTIIIDIQTSEPNLHPSLESPVLTSSSSSDSSTRNTTSTMQTPKPFQR